jgi:protein-S-isoprenylcysteine O-methyltransferase Ste14
MNSTEPEASSSVLSTTKIYPPLLAGGLLLVTLVLHFVLPEERVVGWEQVIGLLLVMFGAVVSSYAAAIFQARDTTRNPYGEPTVLIAMPPYTWTRNPMYLGLTTALLGMAFFFGSIVMLIAPAALFAVIDRIVIPREEATMERLFGGDYVAYSNRVRRWL